MTSDLSYYWEGGREEGEDNKLSEKTHPQSIILQVPTTQVAKIGIDPKFVELTADVVRII